MKDELRDLRVKQSKDLEVNISKPNLTMISNDILAAATRHHAKRRPC